MGDINVTQAASWTEDEFNRNVQYFKDSGQDELATQAQEWRDKGEAGMDEWAKIEAVAATMSADDLARVGKGPHLLDKAETTTPEAAPSSEPAED